MTQDTVYPIHSFAKRARPLSQTQQQALESLYPIYGLPRQTPIDLATLFETHSQTMSLVLEIGFGIGESLVASAEQYPESHFLGIEVYRTGIADVLRQIQLKQLRNLKLIHDDAVAVLTDQFPDHCLDRIHIFFPDPWPKRKHHKRRLIQPNFLTLLQNKLKPNGVLHIKTDWEDYANHVLNVIKHCPAFQALETPTLDFTFPTTKFEKRGLRLKHTIRDLEFILQPTVDHPHHQDRAKCS